MKNVKCYIIALILISFNMNAQKNYSLQELTGRGTIQLYGDDVQLQKEVFEAFEKMRAAAAKEGILIKGVSGYRSFERQKLIWERKYAEYTKAGHSPEKAVEMIIEYSTIPGTSRHHWGTDIDIIDGKANEKGDVLVAEKFHGDGPFCKLKEWMDANANRFGFYLVYTNDPNRKGFKYEPWHYSYLPVSGPMLEAYRKIDIKKILVSEKVSGSNLFSDEFIKRYIRENVLDINRDLL